MIKTQQSLPLQSFLSIKLTGDHCFKENNSFRTPYETSKASLIVVDSFDPVSCIFDIIGLNNPRSKLIYKGKILCPALSFKFYNVQNNDTISVVESQISHETSLKPLSNNNYDINSPGNHIFERNISKSGKANSKKNCLLKNSSSDNTSKHTQKLFLLEKSIKERDSLSKNNIQRYQDALNQMTANESARLTDIYRTRIESNTKSFRKLCYKYKVLINSENSLFSRKIQPSHSSSSLVQLSTASNSEKEKSNQPITSLSTETVLPRKPTFPSTDLLPTFTSMNHI